MDSGRDGLIRQWAVEEFGQAKLGDERRRVRLIAMAARAAQAPSGRVTEVFRQEAERQGAYDFLESPHIDSSALLNALRQACVARCAGLPYVFVPVDGTSITVVDRMKVKDFGAIGTYAQGSRGLKVIDSIAVSPEGVPLGVCAMKWWTRPTQQPQHRHAWSASRKVVDKETQHWLDAIDQAATMFPDALHGTRAWFQVDREGDAWPILRHLAASGQWFTVRSRSNRRLRSSSEKARYLEDARRRACKLGHYLVDVAAGPSRKARVARMELRSSTVTLDLLNAWTKSHSRLTINVVFAREVGTTPRGEKPLVWTLLTNRPVGTLAQSKLVVFGYTQRWRIEEFHKAWKTGVCDVETTQLRARAQVMKWATILAGVAMRVERLKQLAREKPTLEATAELTSTEVEALVLLKRQQKKQTEILPRRLPTIGEATRWLAELGGYTGKSSGGPPGTITIARGLARVAIAAELLGSLKSSGRMR
jgi:hypothetical protein